MPKRGNSLPSQAPTALIVDTVESLYFLRQKMSGSNLKQNTRNFRHAEDDDKNIDIDYNEDTHTIEEEEFNSHQDYDEN